MLQSDLPSKLIYNHVSTNNSVRFYFEFFKSYSINTLKSFVKGFIIHLLVIYYLKIEINVLNVLLLHPSYSNLTSEN